ncbi:hypothetical protein [Streptomyces xanthophaeus]|uniref:hypothetical protein n=1 Tax=Streptomyces xanthophaeus TaxID=67385 RepID=UPI0004CD3C79|nr:hypothetical protein [Streptomyces xanthophaeus]
MSGGEPGLDAPAQALAEIVTGINLAHSELKDLGMTGQATAGRGFSGLALSGLELGDAGLTAEFKTFCDRWEWGVRALTIRGNDFALKVGLSAGAYAEQEQYVKDSFKIAVNSVNGNPHLTEDEVKQMSWDKISKQTMFDGADYSAESFSQAHQEVKQTWKDTGYDVMDAQLDSMQRNGLMDPATRARMDQEMLDTFDPSQGVVEQAEQPRWGDN